MRKGENFVCVRKLNLLLKQCALNLKFGACLLT